MRLMVYSHDAFGLGNLRRMLAICEYLLLTWPRLSILLVSGSPMLQGFRLPQGLDYIKLPCLNRGQSGQLSAKYLGTSFAETIALRSQLILSAAMHFKPDLLLVDKKPSGIEGELTRTLTYLERRCPNTKCVLLLRDILDAPAKISQEWQKQNCDAIIQAHYDRVLVVGMPEVFDLAQAYQFSLPTARKVQYCGYIQKDFKGSKRVQLRRSLGLAPEEKLALVTPGGGEDGFPLIAAYLKGLKTLDSSVPLRSLILMGPEMPVHEQVQLQTMTESLSRVHLQVFTDDLLSYVDAADLVVSMGGYNTLTEILALKKQTIVVPRTHPSQEQLLRAERFAQRGLIKMIVPEALTPQSLIQGVLGQLDALGHDSQPLNFAGLPTLAAHLFDLVTTWRVAEPEPA